MDEREGRERLAQVFAAVAPVLDERARRLVAAAEARALGRGGVTLVAQASGLARSTLRRGRAEVAALDEAAAIGPVAASGLASSRVRRRGGGRTALAVHDPTLLADLEALVDPVTRGDPESPLRWTSKSRSKLAAALRERGHRVSGRTVGRLLRGLGSSLQAARKTTEGADHPDRNAQFDHITEN